MQFKVNGEVFQQIVSKVIKGLSSKDLSAKTMFSIEDEMLVIKCRTDNFFSRGKVPVYDIKKKEKEKETWMVSGTQLSTILSILSNYKNKESVEFNMSDSERVFEIKYNRIKLKLPVEDDDIFPNREEIREIATVDKGLFMSNISNIAKVASQDSSINSAITCVHLVLSPENLTMVATDSIALVEIKQAISDCKKEDTKLLRPSQINLLHAKSNVGEVITLVETDTMFGYEDENDTLVLVATTNLTPLNYKSIKDLVKEEEKMYFDKSEMKFIVDSLSKLCNTNLKQTYIFKDNKLMIQNDNNDMMRLSESLEEGEENNFLDTEMYIPYNSFLSILNIMSDKALMEWAKERNSNNIRVVKFSCLDKDNEINPNIFIMLLEGGNK